MQYYACIKCKLKFLYSTLLLPFCYYKQTALLQEKTQFHKFQIFKNYEMHNILQYIMIFIIFVESLSKVLRISCLLLIFPLLPNKGADLKWMIGSAQLLNFKSELRLFVCK